MKFFQLEKEKYYKITGILENVDHEIYSLSMGLLYSETKDNYSTYRATDIYGLEFCEIFKISNRTKIFLQLLNDDFKWIIKLSNGDIRVFHLKPKKDWKGNWIVDRHCEKINEMAFLTKVDLSFLRKDNEKPYNIKELKEMTF